MQKKNMELLVRGAPLHNDPVCRAIVRATEVGVVVPSLLRQELERLGYRINDDEDTHTQHGYRKFENLYRVLVHDDQDQIVMQGAAGDPAEALLHAVLGYFRELDIAKFGFIVPLELYNVDPTRLDTLKLNDKEVPPEVIARLKSHFSRPTA